MTEVLVATTDDFRLNRRLVLQGFVAAMIGADRAFAQQRRVGRVGILMPYQPSDAVIQGRVLAFKKRIAEEDARIPVYVEQWTGDDLATIRLGLSQMVTEGVDVILTTGSRVIPIVQASFPNMPLVFVGTSDPVGQGFVNSLARPGRNTTGFSQFEFDQDRSPLMGKLVDLIVKMAPGGSRLVLMFNPANPAAAFHRRSFESTATAMGMEPRAAPIRTAAEIDAAMRDAAKESGTRIVLPSDLTLLSHRRQIVNLARDLRLAVGYSDESFVVEGGLLSYAPDRKDMFRRAASYVDRILSGEDAGNLPIQQPNSYILTINVKTAHALGLDVPASILVQADELVD